VTEAGRQNVPIREAMGLTGHRSMVTFMRYFQTGAVQHSKSANLLQRTEGAAAAGTVEKGNSD
jgi:hypothetical protein